MSPDEYIAWYNNLPLIGEYSDTGYNRGFCKFCKQPMFMRYNDDHEVMVDLKHKRDCKPWIALVVKDAFREANQND